MRGKEPGATRPSRSKQRQSRQDWERILAGVRGAVTFGAPLGPFTSFRIGGPADVLVEPADVEDVQRIVAQAKAAKVPVFVVGGTNLLIRDGGIRGIVLSLSKLKAIRQEPGEVLYAEEASGCRR